MDGGRKNNCNNGIVKPGGSSHLPKSVLLELLPAAFEPWGSSGWYAAKPPTEQSVRRIRDEFGITLPPLLVEVATACPSYGGWFNSIGEDYDSHAHILNLNRALRAEGLPEQYVLLNHGHDGDCDAWDTAGIATAGEFPIVYFSFRTGKATRSAPSAPRRRRLRITSMRLVSGMRPAVRWKI